ncbi:glutamine-hydrolyzing GMP synthase [Fulvivirgaceae bacterium PWU5]|uniref:GMP synthase [glutamine-hydrolyzing] n=1 Tax=Dawidia cretensis TaxID=2782350 RepID=A0AAP2E0C1_9BACT|nr:glutamine-hydrolyzing GMP synthase [Dawidia cretensis]MBT1710641.1 glutamine-hydrolyzing GMP synthase [Dawidia cretensis]
MSQQILILDFGSQYTQLIARRVRELNVYCEIHPFNKIPALTPDIKGVILSGSPCSVRDAGSPDIDMSLFEGKVPVLAVCYGAQLLAHKSGGNVLPSTIREYGRAKLSTVDHHNTLLKEISLDTQVWMSHGDTIASVPDSFEIIASTPSVKVAAYRVKGTDTYGIQFHPEVTHTLQGKELLRNFVVHICGCAQDWTSDQFVEVTVADLQKKLGNDRVVMALSGGVDSTVAAILVHKAIGKNLHCIFVDNGLLRKGEFEQVLDSYKHMGLNIKGVDAKEKFYTALAGLTDPEAKRKAIGKTFIDVFDEESHALTDVKWLGQGTIYPDIIESVSVKGPSVTIKSHHNVGGLPEKMKLKIVEPLNTLFKDEVRLVGKTLGIDPTILGRHPFPGPGLGIRILGDITADKVRILQEVDSVFIGGLREHGLYDKVWQAGAMLLPVQSVGVMGDERTYERVVSLRAVTSTDGMTADWAHLPYEFLATVSSDIINKVKGVNRVVYDISSKPPATIEWE